jgi:hypothetical protein
MKLSVEFAPLFPIFEELLRCHALYSYYILERLCIRHMKRFAKDTCERNNVLCASHYTMPLIETDVASYL